jgi:hypothetical protein
LSAIDSLGEHGIILIAFAGNVEGVDAEGGDDGSVSIRQGSEEVVVGIGV